MIAAVIVTYNRKKLLYENIDSLLNQSISFDRIFIIDNCSTDGTYKMLVERGWMQDERFVYIKTESNIGGAGGFYTGTKAAYEAGADWIILMDDDGKAANNDTFDRLMKKANELYAKDRGNKKLFVNVLVQKDELLSFDMSDLHTIKDAEKVAVNGIVENEANPFNGTAISRELVESIGFPNKDFFIKGDEVDYKHRAFQVGAYVCTVVDARYNHPRPETFYKKVFGIKVPFFVEAPWKEYYAARNYTYMYRREKRYKAILFEIVFVKFLSIISVKCKKLATLKMLFRGVRHGWKGKLGATVKP